MPPPNGQFYKAVSLNTIAGCPRFRPDWANNDNLGRSGKPLTSKAI